MKRPWLVIVLFAALVVVIVLGIRAIWKRPDGGSVALLPPAVVVVVDPAHGGRDPGTVADGVNEKDVTLAIAQKIEAFAPEFATLRIVLTRSSDADLSADDRLVVATRENAALYLSIQCNAFTQPTATGAETLVDSVHTQGDAAWAFADAVQKGLVAQSAARDRAVRAQGSSFQRLLIPAATVYVGFLTTPEERTKLVDPTYQDALARGILQGIANHVAAANLAPTPSTTELP
ncbi:MAG: N-acetylmuramoyl-L-alanine amidase [Candidatus Bipolaricaulota bacterium]